MRNEQCTLERFLDGVKNHKMTVIKDDGLYKHLRFRQKDSGTYWYDIITWPGSLTITSDMGTWVFSRMENMFVFFIRDDSNDITDLKINPDYWAEKVMSVSQFGGPIEIFSEKRLEESIIDYVDTYFEDDSTFDREELMKEIQEQIIDYCEENNEQVIFDKIFNFSFEDFSFDDTIHDYNFHEYSFHYTWILYAIVRGIKMYNIVKNV